MSGSAEWAPAVYVARVRSIKSLGTDAAYALDPDGNNIESSRSSVR
jgi:hypothetical protein